MSGSRGPGHDPDAPRVYQIRLKGHLRNQWADWFEGMTIMLEEDGSTLLTGVVIDQSALHGILKKIRDLGMPLLSLHSGDPNEAREEDAGELKDE